MPTSGDRRRLELVRPRAPTAPFVERVRGPGRSIGVADGEVGAGASAFAVELALGLAARGPLTLVACAFGARAPAIEASAHEALTGAGALVLSRAIEASPQGFAGLFTELTTPTWVCVGEPALALLEANLSVLVEGSAGARSLPASLVAHFAHYQLVLESPRLGLARALAASF